MKTIDSSGSAGIFNLEFIFCILYFTLVFDELDMRVCVVCELVVFRGEYSRNQEKQNGQYILQAK